MGKEWLSTKELSEKMGVHVNTLISWEQDLGIRVPRAKNKRRTRMYGEAEEAIFQKIKEFRDENISMENIKSKLAKDIEYWDQEEAALQVIPFSEVDTQQVISLLTDELERREQRRDTEEILYLQKENEKKDKTIEDLSRKIDELTKIISEKLDDKNKSFLERLFKV